MSKLPKGTKVKTPINFLDLEDMKEMCKAILRTNIAVKTFQLRHTDKEQYRDMMNQSILNSKQGLEKINSIENTEIINMIIIKCVGQNNWTTFIQVLGGFSGSLNDQNLYDADKELTKLKVEATLGNKE